MNSIMKKFSFKSIDNFDNHINNSIKGYDLLDYLIVNISSFFIKENTTIVDLGCTSGRLVDKLNRTYNVDCIGYDLVDSNFIETKCDLVKEDITDPQFTILKTNLIISVFTFQFIDINKRLDLLKKVYDSLNVNGAFIFCEKEICVDGVVQEAFTFANYTNKQKTFSAKEILDKEYDLRRIMNSLNSNQNLALLDSAGFKNIEPFFQSLNFKGYICRK